MDKICYCDWGPNDEDIILENDPESEYLNREESSAEHYTEHYIIKFYDKHKFRYSLEYELNKGGKKDIAIILMNPSFADEYHLDYTLNNVTNFIKTLGNMKDFRKLIVLNIFPIRTSDRKDLVQRMNEYQLQQQYNDEKIEEILDNIQDVIVAWGKDYHFIATQKVWFKRLETVNKYAFDLNDNGTPKHFRVYAEDENKSKLDDYRVNIGMMPIFVK